MERAKAAAKEKPRPRVCLSDSRRKTDTIKGVPQRPIDESLWDSLGLSGERRPRRCPPGVYVNGKQLNESHQVWKCGAFHFCGQCGSWCQERPIQLLQSCDAAVIGGQLGSAKLKPSQRESLGRLRKGKPPSHHTDKWGAADENLLVQ